jgi:hypothetical protein
LGGAPGPKADGENLGSRRALWGLSRERPSGDPFLAGDGTQPGQCPVLGNADRAR